MKNLKVKSILFSLLAIIAVTLFLTSCEQENVVEEIVVGSWKEDSFINDSQADLILSEIINSNTVANRNDMDNFAQEDVIENAEFGFRAPKILAEDIEYGSCCGKISLLSDNKRNVEIILNHNTAGFFCSNGRSLTYEFALPNNPAVPIITKTTNNTSPTFCLPAVNLNLVIRYGFSYSPTYSITPVTCQP